MAASGNRKFDEFGDDPFNTEIIDESQLLKSFEKLEDFPLLYPVEFYTNNNNSHTPLIFPPQSIQSVQTKYLMQTEVYDQDDFDPIKKLNDFKIRKRFNKEDFENICGLYGKKYIYPCLHGSVIPSNSAVAGSRTCAFLTNTAITDIFKNVIHKHVKMEIVLEIIKNNSVINDLRIPMQYDQQNRKSILIPYIMNFLGDSNQKLLLEFVNSLYDSEKLLLKKELQSRSKQTLTEEEKNNIQILLAEIERYIQELTVPKDDFTEGTRENTLNI